METDLLDFRRLEGGYESEKLSRGVYHWKRLGRLQVRIDWRIFRNINYLINIQKKYVMFISVLEIELPICLSPAPYDFVQLKRFYYAVNPSTYSLARILTSSTPFASPLSVSHCSHFLKKNLAFFVDIFVARTLWNSRLSSASPLVLCTLSHQVHLA